MTVPARDTPAIVVYTQGTIEIDDSFNIIFPFLANDEYIKVTLRLNDETTQDLVLDEDFSVVTSDGTNSVYGICVFLKEFADIKRICIERNIAPDQDVSFTSQTVFTETTETAIDKVTMLAQDYRVKEYALRVPDDEVVFDGTMQLPPSNVRANKYLYFDTFGLPTAGMGPDQSKALRQGQGEETDPTFEMGFIERRNKGIIFDSDASVVLTEREKILNEHLQGGDGISVITLEGALTTSISAIAGDNVTVDESGISVPIAQDTKLGVVMAGQNTSIGAGGEINAVNTEYSAGNGIAVSEAGVISAVAGDNVTVDEDGIAVAIGTTTNFGVLQVGTNLAVTDGVISAPASTGTALGVVKAGTNTSIGAGGEINAVDTTYAAGNGLQLSTGMFSVRAHSNVVVDSNGVSVPVATSSSLGVMQVGSGLAVTEAGVVSASNTGSITYPFTIPTSGWYFNEAEILFDNNKLPPMNKIITVSGVSVAVGEYGIIATDSGGTWTEIKSVVSTSLKSIAYGSGKYVAVGNSGVILTGTSILSLAIVVSGTTANLTNVCWTGTRFIAIGEGGVVFVSTDGLVWVSKSSGTANSLYGIHHGYLGTVIVGASGYVGLSTDNGDTWTAKTSGVSVSLFAVSVAGEIIIVGASGTILTTPDLTTFTARTSGTTESLRAIDNAIATTVVVGDSGKILYSGDLSTWTTDVSIASLSLSGVVHNGSKWIAVGYEYVLSVGTLGNPWVLESPITLLDIRGGCYANGLHVLVGTNGLILVSSDEVTYTKIEAGITEDLFDVVYGNSKWVICGYNTILTSATALSWTAQTSPSVKSIMGITFSQTHNKFIVVTTADSGRMSHSSTAETGTWTSVFPSDQQWTNVAEHNGLVVVTATYGNIWKSTDLSTWTHIGKLDSHYYYGVTFNSDKCVVVGKYGKIMVTTIEEILDFVPGTDIWTDKTSGTSSHINAVKFIGKMFIACGESGYISTSNEDANVWTVRSSSTAYRLTDISFSSDEIIVTGDDGTTIYGFSTRSNDISIVGVTNTDVGIADVILTRNIDTAELEKIEWDKVDMIDTYADKITVTCLDEIPSISLSCQLKV